MSNVNAIVNEALSRWIDIAKIDVESGRTTGTAVEWPSYQIDQLTEDLNESRELDPSGVTTFMLLRGVIDRYLKDVTFDAHTVINDPKYVAHTVAPLRALRDVLDSPEVVELIGEFQERIRTAMTTFKVRPESMAEVEELLSNRWEIGMLRRDALRSMETLKAHQFTQGQADKAQPKFNPTVFEFWNINSLLAAMRAQRLSGISLCLIRDPAQVFNSYFVFAIRNGETMTVLTDQDRGAHPAQSRMSRRPDRQFARRAAQHWFPYQLLDLAQSKTDDRLFAKARHQLVPLNTEAVPLKPVGELEPAQMIWLGLVFDRIRERFWTTDLRLPGLSYTGQMVVEPEALVGTAGSLVKSGLYKPLELPTIKKADLAGAADDPQWGRKGTGFNQWMVDRYGDKVPDNVLNIVGDSQRLLLEKETGEAGLLVKKGNDEDHKQLETLSPLTFGTAEELQKDRVWVARMNQMKVIQKLAMDEFERTEADLRGWIQSRVEANREFLLNAAARGELQLPLTQMMCFADRDGEDAPPDKRRPKTANALKQAVGERWDKCHAEGIWFNRPAFQLGKPESSYGRHYCAERPDVFATVFTWIEPTCPEALALVFNVTVKDLPWQLQHWYRHEPYEGNSILERLDPAAWVLRNPWIPGTSIRGIAMRVGIAQCKGAYHARRKALGLPRRQFNEGEEEK